MAIQRFIPLEAKERTLRVLGCGTFQYMYHNMPNGMQAMNLVPTALPFRGALMRATWTRARLGGLVLAVGGEFAGDEPRLHKHGVETARRQRGDVPRRGPSGGSLARAERHRNP